jgi:hypothetical protein
MITRLRHLVVLPAFTVATPAAAPSAIAFAAGSALAAAKP